MTIRFETDDDGHIAIWTEPEPAARYVGRCIGIGHTLDEAKLDAIRELHDDLAAIDALTPDDEDDGVD